MTKSYKTSKTYKYTKKMDKYLYCKLGCSDCKRKFEKYNDKFMKAAAEEITAFTITKIVEPFHDPFTITKIDEEFPEDGYWFPLP